VALQVSLEFLKRLVKMMVVPVSGKIFSILVQNLLLRTVGSASRGHRETNVDLGNKGILCSSRLWDLEFKVAAKQKKTSAPSCNSFGTAKPTSVDEMSASNSSLEIKLATLSKMMRSYCLPSPGTHRQVVAGWFCKICFGKVKSRKEGRMEISNPIPSMERPSDWM
jgi:hypothetical protein